MQNALSLSVALADIRASVSFLPCLATWKTQERPLIGYCQKWSRL
jgi:hypothetical protein